MNISPKAVTAFLLPFVAAGILFIVTGDSTYLVGLLLAVVAGGGAALAPPATGVSQAEVERLAETPAAKRP